MNKVMEQTQLGSILIIDDELQIQTFLDIALRAQGYATFLSGSGKKGLDILSTQQIDLVILDLGLPDMEGIQVLRELRKWLEIPVIVLSARPDEHQKIMLLDAGANDYVTKPFSIQELCARIRVLFRNHAQKKDETTLIFDDGYLKVDFAKRLTFFQNEVVPLTKKEFQLLSLLIKNRGQLLTQPQILKELWGPTHQDDKHYLRILVARLRTKLKDEAINPKYIITEPGVGLRFM
ncbi:response regulator [Acinetobacter baumannii]|nr:response regulator [Acinetobacter baumannii]TPU56990.1 response regulator [Acinetobacter baumannii]